MRKNISIILFIVFNYSLYSQVGIGTEEPKATLDIVATNPNDSEDTTTDGVLIPRLSKGRAQNMLNVEESTLIYINDISDGSSSGTAEFINTVGFYFFDNNKWNQLNPTNKLEPEKRIFGVLNFEDDQVLIERTIEQELKLTGEIKGINIEDNITFLENGDDKYRIKFPANKVFKITGSIGLRGSVDSSGENHPLYIFTKFVLDDPLNVIIKTEGYTESSTERFDDGGQSNPMIIFKTGSDGNIISMSASYGGMNSKLTNGAYIAGAPTSQSIGSYLVIEEMN